MTEIGTALPPRGIFLPNGKPIISTPSPEQIAVINAHPKTEYFTTLGAKPEIIANWTTHFGLHRAPGLLNFLNRPESEYRHKYISSPLWEKLASEFGLELENLAVRGTAVAIGSPVRTKSRGEIRTLAQVLEEGTDTGSNQTRVAVLTPSRADHSPISYSRDHSEAYLISWAQIFRNDVEREGDDKLIHPVALIYNTKNMAMNYGDVILPDDPILRRGAIVKAYVLDYIHGENTKKLF